MPGSPLRGINLGWACVCVRVRGLTIKKKKGKDSNREKKIDIKRKTLQNSKKEV